VAGPRPVGAGDRRARRRRADCRPTWPARNPVPEPIRVGMRVNVMFRKLSKHITLPLFETGRQRHFGLVSPLFRRQLVSPQTNSQTGMRTQENDLACEILPVRELLCRRLTKNATTVAVVKPTCSLGLVYDRPTIRVANSNIVRNSLLICGSPTKARTWDLRIRNPSVDTLPRPTAAFENASPFQRRSSWPPHEQQ